MWACTESSSMIRSTSSRLVLLASSPAFSNCLNSFSTVLWSSLSNTMASMRGSSCGIGRASGAWAVPAHADAAENGRSACRREVLVPAEPLEGPPQPVVELHDGLPPQLGAGEVDIGAAHGRVVDR